MRLQTIRIIPFLSHLWKQFLNDCMPLLVTLRYEELCTFLLEQVPSLNSKNKIHISDGLFLPEETTVLFFPHALHLDDAFHMVNINCVRNCPVHEVMAMKPLVWKMVKTYDEFEFNESLEALQEHCPHFIPGEPPTHPTSTTNMLSSYAFVVE